MINFRLFFNAIFSQQANKTEVRQALLDKNYSIFPELVNISGTETTVLMKMLDSQPRWRFCMIQGPLLAEWDKGHNVCFASKAVRFNLKETNVHRWIPDKDDKGCTAAKQQTWCSQQVEVGPKITPKGGIIKAAREKFMNKTEIKSNLPYVAQIFRGIFPMADLKKALDETAEGELCSLGNISITEYKKKYCVFGKNMIFGGKSTYETQVAKVKQKGRTCLELLQQVKLLCSTRDVSDTPEPSLTTTPIPTLTSTSPKTCVVFLEDNSAHKSVKIFDSSTSTRPLIRKMISAEFEGRTALVASTFEQEVYVIWNPLSFPIIDLKAVKNHSIPGIVLSCSSFPFSAQFGYSLAMFNHSLIIGAPNATVNQPTSGIVFGVQSIHALPNATVDICSNAFKQYTWNITNSNSAASYRLGDTITHGTIYGKESLIITEGSSTAMIYVMQNLTRSCDLVNIKADYCNGFRGRLARTNAVQLSDIKIAALDFGNSKKQAIIFIGCPTCSVPSVFSWSIVPDQQALETIGASKTITHRGLDSSAVFGESISLINNAILIGAPQAHKKGAVYDYTISSDKDVLFRGGADLSSSNPSLITLHPEAGDDLFGTSVRTGTLAEKSALVISSPAYHNNVGKVDVLINPHFQESDVTVSANHVSFAERYIQIKSHSADMSMLGGGVVEFLYFHGQPTLALAGANATDGWIFSTLSCD